MGVDLGAVRLHDDADARAAADQLGARAFAHGVDIHFGAGELQPGTPEGDSLIMHELTHVGRGHRADASDAAETEADALAEKVGTGASGCAAPRAGSLPAAPGSSGVHRKLKVAGKERPWTDPELMKRMTAGEGGDQLLAMVMSPKLFVFASWANVDQQVQMVNEQQKAADEVLASVGFAGVGSDGRAAIEVDKTYWKQDGDYLYAVTKDHAAAVTALVDTTTRLECNLTAQLIQLRAHQRALGDSKFNKRLTKLLRGKPLRLPLNDELVASRALASEDPADPDSEADGHVMVGEHVVFKAQALLERAPERLGQWQNENTVCTGYTGRGDPLFVGAGVGGPMTTKEMKLAILAAIVDDDSNGISNAAKSEIGTLIGLYGDRATVAERITLLPAVERLVITESPR